MMKPGELAEQEYTLESGRPLSQSSLWRLQRRYFDRAGIAAWSAGDVPLYVTSNPFIARAYAQTVAAFVRDGMTAHTIDPAQPLYVLELGAGSGRFAFGCMRALHAALPEEGPAPVYVMTEYNDALIDFWREHPQLRPFVAAGQLDFARFDAMDPNAPLLRENGGPLSGEPAANPIIVIANYFLDSIPQDVFFVSNGLLHENLASLVASRPDLSLEDPAALPEMRLGFEPRAIETPYYHETDLDGLLDTYRRMLRESNLSFPAQGIRCLRRLIDLSGGRIFVLSADKGYHCIEDLQERPAPGFESHGSLSMAVNYHALAAYFEIRGGQALHLDHRPQYLDVCGLLLDRRSADGHEYAETRRAWQDSMAGFGPEEYYLIGTLLRDESLSLSVEQALALLRLGDFDPRTIERVVRHLLDPLPKASPLLQSEMKIAMQRAWERYFYIGETYDFPYDLGVLSYKISDYETALAYFTHSVRLHGPNPKTSYNSALCHRLLGNREAALERLREAMRLDPEFEPALAMLAKMERQAAEV